MMRTAIILLVAALQLNYAFGDPTGRPTEFPTGRPTEDQTGKPTATPEPTFPRTTDEEEPMTQGPTFTPTRPPFTTRLITDRPGPPRRQAPTCKIDYNTDYLGCDIGASIRPSWQECAEACQKHKGCRFWVYAPSIKKCHYKNRKCNVRGKNKIVSGNRACGERCTVDYSTDYLGCDISSTTEGSWQECAKTCSRTKGCNYWTWAHRMSSRHPLKCYLKNRQCNIKVGEPNVISGNRACAVADDQRCTPYYAKDWTCRGVILEKCNIFKWQACADLCNRTPACRYWTWTHSRSSYLPNNCFLRKAGNCRLKSQGNTLAGERYCRGVGTGRY